MESASPEPSRDRATTRANGTAVQGPATADDGRPRPHAVAASEHTVVVLDDQRLPVDTDRLTRLARLVLRHLDVPAELELSITCVGREAMAELNAAHMRAEGPTDVLAFPIDDVAHVVAGVPGLLGDVVLCPPVAAAQAAERRRAPQDELDMLLVHGILHLLGHDHAGADERDLMFGLTDELLAMFVDGVSR